MIAPIAEGRAEGKVVGGAVTKARVLKEWLEEHLMDGVELKVVDTTWWKYRPWILLSIIVEYLKADCVIVLVFPTSAMRLAQIFSFLKLFKKDVLTVYVEVGSTLPLMLKKNPNFKKLLDIYDVLAVETQMSEKFLGKVLGHKIRRLGNFRKFDIGFIDRCKKMRNTVNRGDEFRFVFFSRVIPEKGVELAIEAVKKVRELVDDIKITLDIYGPIPDYYSSRFLRLIEKEDYVTYRGVMVGDKDVYNILCRYDVMLLPTKIQYEGIPGAIIDGCVVGLPVISTNFPNVYDVVRHGETGFIVNMGDIESLVDAMVKVVKERDKLETMRENCYRLALEFHIEKVMKRFIKANHLMERCGIKGDAKKWI